MVSQLGLVRGSLFLMDVFLNVHVMGLYVHDSLFILILVALDYVLKLIHILTVRLTAFLEAGVFHLSFMDNALLANFDIRDLLLVHWHSLYLLNLAFTPSGNIAVRMRPLVDVSVCLEVSSVEIGLPGGFLLFLTLNSFNFFKRCMSGKDGGLNVGNFLPDDPRC